MKQEELVEDNPRIEEMKDLESYMVCLMKLEEKRNNLLKELAKMDYKITELKLSNGVNLGATNNG